MRYRVPVLAGGIVLLGFLAPSHAATTIGFNLKQVGEPDVMQTAYIDDGNLLIKAAGGDPTTDLLFQQSIETMTIINHTDKTTLDIDAAKVGALASQAEGMMSIMQQQIAAQMEGMSDEEKEQFEKMMENMGGGQLMPAPAPPPLPKTFKDMGTQTINGYDCEKTLVYQGDEVVSEVCTAEPADLGIPAADYAVMQAMQAMAKKLRDKTAKLSAQMGQSVPQFGDTDLPGVPVQITDGAGNAMNIVHIEDGIGDAVLSKPSNYTPTQMPSLPQLTQ